MLNKMQAMLPMRAVALVQPSKGPFRALFCGPHDAADDLACESAFHDAYTKISADAAVR